MSFIAIRVSALTGILVLIAGCGGSSGGSGGTNPSTITYNFGSPAPTAVAVKIGTGDFAPATVTSGQVSFTLPDGTTDFAVAYACPGFSLPESNVTENSESLLYSTSLDGTTFSVSCHSVVPGITLGTTFNGTLIGVVNSSSFAGARWLSVWAWAANSGFGQSSFNLSQSDDFSMTIAPPGTDDVVLSLFDSSGNALAVKNLGDQTVPGAVNSGSPVNFGTGDATTFQPIAYVNVPAGYSVPFTSVDVSSTGFSFPLQMNGFLGFNSQNLLTQYSVLPAGLAESSDRYEISSAATKQFSYATSAVNFSTTLTGGGPATITFPAPWPYAGPTPAALPTLDFSYTPFAGQSGLSYEGYLEWEPASGIDDSIDISLTQNYQSASPSVTVPDLSGIPGFLAAPASGKQVFWRGQIFPAGFTTSSSPNATFTSASNDGTYIVP